MGVFTFNTDSVKERISEVIQDKTRELLEFGRYWKYHKQMKRAIQCALLDCRKARKQLREGNVNRAMELMDY